MNYRMLICIALCAIALLAFGSGCSDSSTTEPVDDDPVVNHLPTLPVPASSGEVLPDRTPDHVVGLSGPLDQFDPHVERLEVMLDDGSMEWHDEDRRLVMACPGTLPCCMGDPSAADPHFIKARPRLLHTRHWRKLDQNLLYPGTSYTLTKEVTWGASTSHQESTEFSQTLGVEVSVGGTWDVFSATVKGSYSQTTTWGVVNTVSFTSEDREERTYTVVAPADEKRLYVLWQLVDEFTFVDADTIPIHDSPTLTRVEIAEVAPILFPNESNVVMQTTDFD